MDVLARKTLVRLKI